MDIRLVTPATAEPVSVAEAKAQLRLQQSADDSLIGWCIAAARELAELRTGAALVESTWEQVMEGFPWASALNPFAAIRLEKHPVQAVTSIAYVDGDGASQTIDAANWRLVKGGGPGAGAIYPAYGFSWPSTRRQIDAVTVTFTAGWPLDGDDAPTTPQAIRKWILQRVASMYENPTDLLTGSGSLLGVEAPRTFVDGLLDPHTIIRSM